MTGGFTVSSVVFPLIRLFICYTAVIKIVEAFIDVFAKDGDNKNTCALSILLNGGVF